MENSTHTIYKSSYTIGLVSIITSFLIYLLNFNDQDTTALFSQTFFLNYLISVGYLVLLFFNRIQHEKPRPSISYGCWINVVILFTISAFSLNKEMVVFSPFPTWLNIYTLLSIPLFLVFPYLNKLPAIIKAVIFFLSGLSLTLSIYMFLYLLPLFPITIIGLLVFGISIHTFVPAIWLLVLINFLLFKTDKSKLKWFIVPGFLLPLFFLIFYLNKWNGLQNEIKDIVAEQNIKFDHKLPNHLYLAQKLPSDILTEEILVAPFKSQRFWGDESPMSNNNGVKYHNPLSTIATALYGDVGLDEETSEAILNIRKDQRHLTTRKLWTGTNLSTSSISTNILLFPEYRLAYHEKTMVIHNNPLKNNRQVWFTSETQEALYTFHLPEGSIVTSLSLWINGKEEKSRLSTVQKADSAYKKIVGVERRDPAVVHWQEGNKVTVNVFPCTPKEDRTFKVGFTTPLKYVDKTLTLENIWFEGPDSRGAREVTQIIVNSSCRFREISNSFALQANGNYLYKGDYNPYWEIKLNAPSLSNNKFVFGGNSYKVTEAKSESINTTIKNVYLDLTKEWTKEEFESMVSKFNDRNIYTWLPELTLISKANSDIVWKEGNKNQFSFPFLFDIEDPEHSVVITKTSHRSPILAELKNSSVAERYTEYFQKDSIPLHVINIGKELSPFWRSMRELRLIYYDQLDYNLAISKINKGTLNKCHEDSNTVVINDSKLCIIKEASIDSNLSKAPDHLLRVFAYNDILRKIGTKYFEKEKYENALFREAEESFVVSPVTSMIVLESETDYQRMGIDKNNNSVGNASALGGGAVPEPHEWVLIALVGFIILRHFYKRKLAL